MNLKDKIGTILQRIRKLSSTKQNLQVLMQQQQ